MAAKTLLEKTPTPMMKLRPFHGRKLAVWEGLIKYDKITGWVDNPRIQLSCQRKKQQVGNRELTQDEVYEIMKIDREVKLDILRDDILQNGLREPIVLSHTGRLLDGNRRYFAIRFLLESIPKGDPNRADFEKIHAYILDDTCTAEDESLVLVEENFHTSLKIEWPDYVKAQHIKADWEKGLDPSEIAKRYGWDRRKVGDTIKIIQLIDDFISYATADEDKEDEFGGGLGVSEIQAETIAAENYQFFNEAQKSFYNQLNSDSHFKVTFFRWISEGKFSSFPEVRIAYDAWQDPEARSIIGTDAPSAAKDAKAVIDYKKRVLKGKEEARYRIEEFTRFLESLTAEVIGKIPPSTTASLDRALTLVKTMCEAVQNPRE